MTALRALLLLTLTASGTFSSEASPKIMGYTTQTITPGLQTVGVTLNNPVVFSGKVIGSTDEAIPSLTFSTTTDIGSLLDSSKAYYLEIVDGDSAALYGDRLDIDTALTKAGDADGLILKEANYNTLSFPLAEDLLIGYRVVIKEHVTIGQVFGTKEDSVFSGSTNISLADQVLVYDPSTGGYKTYFLLETPTGSVKQWRLIGGGATKRDDTVIPPGSGLFVKRNGGSDVDLVLLGNVRTNDFVMPLQSGSNFVTLPTPTNESPTSLLMSLANGFTGSTNVSRSDQILIYNGTGFDTYFLLATPTGSVQQWRKIGGGSVNYSATELMSFSDSFFIKKINDDPDYTIYTALSL